MDSTILRIIGILMYIILSVVDRFIYKIPDYVYIPLAILGIILIIIGFIIEKKAKGGNK